MNETEALNALATRTDTYRQTEAAHADARAETIEAVLAALAGGADFCCVHVEAPDECAHAGDVQGKCEAIRRLDSRVVAPLLARLGEVDPDYRILLLSDHPTLLRTRGHDGGAVPFAIYDSRRPGTPRKFDEAHARATGDFLAEGPMLLRALFA